MSLITIVLDYSDSISISSFRMHHVNLLLLLSLIIDYTYY